MYNTQQLDPLDQNLFVTFRNEVLIDESESLEKGTPVTQEKEFVKMVQRGSGKEIYDGIAKQDHINRFPEQYQRFKDNKSQDIVDGIGIEKLPGITQQQVVVCKYLKLSTVEQVAGMIDGEIKKLGDNGRTLVKACRDFLTGTNSLKEKVTEQEDKIAKLEAMIESLQEKKPTRRRKKVEDESINNNTEGDKTE